MDFRLMTLNGTSGLFPAFYVRWIFVPLVIIQDEHWIDSLPRSLGGGEVVLVVFMDGWIGAPHWWFRNLDPGCPVHKEYPASLTTREHSI